MQIYINKKTLPICFILLFCFFQNWLLEVIPFLGYFDEVIAFLAIFYFLCFGKKNSNDLILLAISVLIIVAGVVFNIMSGIQSSVAAIIEDISGIFKFFFVYLGVKAYLDNNSISPEYICYTLSGILKIYTLIMLVCAIANNAFGLGMDSGTRYGLKMFAFIYGTSGHIINQMTYVLILLNGEKLLLKKENGFWEIVALIVMASTFKARAFVLIGLYLALKYFFILRSHKRLGVNIAIIGGLTILIGYSQFEYYFMTEGTPRQMFISGAAQLVREYFPFGTGFGTFGSSAAISHYSPLYYTLGFSSRYGMTPDNPVYLNDNYFPMIFVEFGIFIGVLFLYLIYRIFKSMIKETSVYDNPIVRFTTYFFIFDIVFSCIQSSYLAHYSVVALTLFFMMLFYPQKRNYGVRK